MKKKTLLMAILLIVLMSMLFNATPMVHSQVYDRPHLSVVTVSDVIDSNQTWRGNTVISAGQDILVVNSTITIADGNVTVYGNLTFENARVAAKTPGSWSFFFVTEYGNLTMTNTNMTREFCIASSLNAKVEIYDSIVWDIESRNASRVRVVRSSANSTYAFDDSKQDMIIVNMTNVDVYSRYSGSPTVDMYNCTVEFVKATNCHLNIAHTTIGQLDSHGYALLKFDNMTITGSWTHDGMLYWWTGRSVGWGNYWSIQWGETKASGTINGTGTEFKIEEAEFMPNPPTGKVYVGACMSISFKGNCTLHMRIYYTDQQVANVKVSTLKLYSRSDSLWQQLSLTGVNATGKYVWGNITSEETTFSKCFAALGTPTGVGGIVIPIDKIALLAPYIGLASTIAVATVATAVYVRRVKHRKEKQ